MNRGQSQQHRSTGAMAQTRLMWQLVEDKKRKEDKNNTESLVANDPGKTENPGALINDSPGAGGMSKAAFLQELDQNIRTTADPLLAKAGRSSANCPWINFVMQFYQSHSAEALLKAIHDFIPGSIYAQSPADLMAMITERTQSSVATWVETGQITGLPKDVQARLPKHLMGEAKENEAEQAHQQLSKGGQALEGSIKNLMESALGANLSEVKIHTGSEAGVLTGQHKAKALTVGQHIAFDTGEYKPGTPEGDALLAHELAHTVQQKEAGKETEKTEEPANEEGFENEANEVAEEAVTGIWGKVKKLRKKIGKGLKGGLQVRRCSDDKPDKLTDTALSAKSYIELIDEWKKRDTILLEESAPDETTINDETEYMLKLHDLSNQDVIEIRNIDGNKRQKKDTGIRAAYTEVGDLWIEMKGQPFLLKEDSNNFLKDTEVEVLYWSRWTSEGDNVIVKSKKDGTIGKLNKESLTTLHKKEPGLNYYNTISSGDNSSTYSQNLIKETMYNRFDKQILHWVDFYNTQLIKPPLIKADPNVLKSLIFQESRFGVGGEHLLLPPYDETLDNGRKANESSSAKSRYNLGQAIDTLPHQQFFMMKEMAPDILKKYGLDKYCTPFLEAKHKQKEITKSGTKKISLSKTEQDLLNDPSKQKENEGYEYFYDIPSNQIWNIPNFTKALDEYTSSKDSNGDNLNASKSKNPSTNNLLLDYDYMIRTTTRFWFQMYLDTVYDTEQGDWTIATQRYNGSGSNSRIYKKQVYSRVDFHAMHPELKDNEVNIVEGTKNEGLGNTNSLTEDPPKTIVELETRLEWQEKPIKDIVRNEINPYTKSKRDLITEKNNLVAEKKILESDKTKAKNEKEKNSIEEQIKKIEELIKVKESEILEIDGKIDAAYLKANTIIKDQNLEQIPWQK